MAEFLVKHFCMFIVISLHLVSWCNSKVERIEWRAGMWCVISSTHRQILPSNIKQQI